MTAEEAAIKFNDDLGKLFRRLGTAENLQGVITTPYRNAARAMRGQTGNVAATEEVLAQLKKTIEGELSGLMDEAKSIGREQAETTLQEYDIPIEEEEEEDDEIILLALLAILALLNSQIAAIKALVGSGATEDMILGDGQRVGALTPTPLNREITRWLATVGVKTATDTMIGSLGDQRGDFVKQAVAVIDARTTKTCQRVNGQIRELNEPFELTSTPRYADEMDGPPFHDYCRTTIAIRRRDEVEG